MPNDHFSFLLMSSNCCISGSLWQQSQPKGIVSSMWIGNQDIKLYMTGKGKRIVIMLSDIFGPYSPNIQILADKLAILMPDTSVVIPDILSGDWISLDLLRPLISKPKTFWETWITPVYTIGWALPTLAAWRWRLDHAKVKRRVDDMIDSLSGDYTEVFSWGFCFGGRYSVCAGRDARVRAIACAHPGLLRFEEVRELRVPNIWICAEVDYNFPDSFRTKAEQFLHAREPESKWMLYPDTVHGFSIRGDEGIDTVVKARDDAVQQVASFFLKHSE